MMKKLKNNIGGINRVIAALLVLIAIMLVVISIPASEAFRKRSERIACEQAMKSAGDGLIIEYLGRMKEGDVEEARKTLIEVMPARENICPTGGNVYLIKNEHGIYEPVCGLHDPDKALRTRLNASCALNLLKEKRRKILEDPKASKGKSAEKNTQSEKSETVSEPKKISVTVNSKPLACTHVVQEEMIHRGTDTTNGYKGVVAFYGVAGDFTFSTKYANKGYGNVEEGDICYFVYADEDYCAIWRSNDGWTGDAYDAKN